MCARLRQGCVVQEIVSSAEKDSEAAVCQLLSKHTIDATPECEEEDSTSESQPPGTKKQQLDSYMESSGPVPSGAAKVTFQPAFAKDLWHWHKWHSSLQSRGSAYCHACGFPQQGAFSHYYKHLLSRL